MNMYMYAGLMGDLHEDVFFRAFTFFLRGISDTREEVDGWREGEKKESLEVQHFCGVAVLTTSYAHAIHCTYIHTHM